MSATAQSNTLPRSSSSTRRPPSSAYEYNTSPANPTNIAATVDNRDRPHRAHSVLHRNAPPSSPRRSMSASRAPASAHHSRSPSANLEKVARQDFEQTNLPGQQSASPRRSESQDPSAGNTPAHLSRSESTRQSSGHGRTQSRYKDQATPASTSGGGSNSNHSHHASESRAAAPPTQLRRRTTIDAQTGHWELGKTIGAGSMGKVKLARNKATGEQVAVKIVPRQSTEGEHRTQADRDRADRSKEVRTAREAAIVTLVDHPYICGMRDVVRTGYHWYMLFEYVNGGQMLDYIISHGRLKEKQARKFGRQIASALDYCHRNSIVHRDLKIENILISNNGDIKIIDFGLSNLFSPRDHLKTFCGSLYFAAPELLQAKAYTGPEVDVWSFGIVLYVLVCGKVPFDDQSMPQLHAKIKKGVVEYPPWLTPECRGLIARMLMTNPSERATMHEIMNHPWMTKGFSGPPENHLPERKPVQLPLDPEVVAKMTGFDFGNSKYITEQLTAVIESEDYQRAVRLMEKRMSQPNPESEQKRGVFGFYKRRGSTTSKDTLNTPSVEAIQSGTDPINAYSPFLSVYYLAREKIEREAREKNPGALALPQSPDEKPLQIPSVTTPPVAHTNSQTYEMTGEKPTGGRSRPRARTHGEDEIADGIQNIDVNAAPSPLNANPTIIEPSAEQQSKGHSRKESTAAGILRRFSKRSSVGDRLSHPPAALAAYSKDSNSESPRKSIGLLRTRDNSQNRESTGTAAGDASFAKQAGLLSPPAGDDTPPGSSAVEPQQAQVKRHGLGRSVSVNSSDIRRRLSRRGASEGSAEQQQQQRINQQARPQPSSSLEPSGQDIASDAERSSSRPHTTIGMASRARSMGHGSSNQHSRKESLPSSAMLRSQQGRPTSMISSSKRESSQFPTSTLPRPQDVREETDQEIEEEEIGSTHDRRGSRTRQSHKTGDADDYDEDAPSMKPVYLKGLFSSSTTTSRPLPVIRADIIRVLRELDVEFREIRGGFSCRHWPSIVVGNNSPDEKSVNATAGEDGATPRSPPQSPPHQAASIDGSTGGGSTGHRRKISFAGFRASTSADRPPPSNTSASQPPNDDNIYSGPSDVDYSEDETGHLPSSTRPQAQQPSRTKRYSRIIGGSSTPVPRDASASAGGSNATHAVGETSTHVHSDLGAAMTALRFEIILVKVPLLQLHGIQFKKVDGGTWQYKAMAQRILGGLRL